MKTLRLRIARLALVLGVAAACWACNAPFIPIPPPGQRATFTSAIVADGNGGQKTVWIAHGPPNMDAASARFYVWDENRKAGVIAQAAPDGSFDSQPMDGDLNDFVDIKFETPAGGLTMDVCFKLTTDTVPETRTQLPTAPPCN
jgi:hypothetical protein